MTFRDTIPQSNKDLRQEIYNGAIFKLPPTAASRKAVSFLKEQLAARIGTPVESAHKRISTTALQKKLDALRQEITQNNHCQNNHCLALAREMMAGTGFSLNENAFDLLRLHLSLPGWYLRPELERSHSIHRDTWYANSQSQINWWVALNDEPAARTFSFYPAYFSQAIQNNSQYFRYPDWAQKIGWQNTSKSASFDYPRILTAQQDLQKVSFSCKSGEILLFSAAHLHATNPNKTDLCRFSFDFRTVHLEDCRRGLGAPNADNDSSPDALSDYIMPDGIMPDGIMPDEKSA